MKPEFALSLSPDGIALLLRGAGGWRRVGTVALQVDDLPTELAILRSKAEEHAAGRLYCKLLLPDTQIKYLTIETGDLPYDDRIEAARAALDGATPYAVADLAFDISLDGVRTHIAAVAIETLGEAESFAIEHGFSPVSFVAAPGAHDFLGEPFFGTARSARGLDVEPDGIAVVDVGPLPADQPPPSTEGDSLETGSTSSAASLPASPETAADIASGTPGEPVEEPDLYASSDLETELAPRAHGNIVLPAAPPLDDVQSLDVSLHSPGDTAPVNQDASLAASDTEAEDETGPTVGFSSRRKPGASIERPVVSGDTAAGEAKRSFTVLAVAPDADAVAPVAAPVADIADASVPPAPNLSMPMPVLANTTSAPPKRAPATVARPVSGPAGDIGQMPQAHPLRLRPARVGFIAAALATLSALGAWALVQELPTLWSDLERADLIETEDPIAPPILTHTTPPATNSAQTDSLSTPEIPGSGGNLAQGATTSPQQLSISDNDLQQAGVQLTAADLPPESHQDPDELTVTDAAVLAALGTPIIDEATPLDAQDLVIASLPEPRSISDGSFGAALLPDVATDPAFDVANLADVGSALDPEALADGMVPGEDTGFDDGLDGDVAALTQAAQYAATGIWQQIPAIAELPALIDLDDVYVASIDHTDLSQDAIALPAGPDLDTDVPFGAISSPTAAGRQFDLNERGLVKATPEGTLNPDGIMVFQGRPQITPPATPDRPEVREQDAADAAERTALLRLVRPRTRPLDLVEQTERAQLGGVIRSELLSKRPRLRPASLKTEAQESQPATEQAVASVVKPRARPTNFANLVDRAQRSTRSAEVQTASVAPAAVSPSIPTSVSVARQATVQRALNLRHLNLIGVYGKPSERRALVRLPSGRYVKVKVGDRIDGGRIVAIGEAQLQYQKGGRNQTLTMPKG
ncbi:hypothetical protein [Phaeobacter sp. B1627]|uniref:hypothetical protein n=1 Tax=Phaeobacter sp. B1627 TaxID=2583809 RepID=UPI00111A053D|nr:hypothetical protein [Phaeobacter sp. B1627]TNJ41760.1 hypothetical protein FGE21_12750 [Phaeobacter sp. B1627]